MMQWQALPESPCDSQPVAKSVDPDHVEPVDSREPQACRSARVSARALSLAGGDRGGEFMPPRPFPQLAALVGTLFGGLWIIRISRGLREEPPPWRYRDR